MPVYLPQNTNKDYLNLIAGSMGPAELPDQSDSPMPDLGNLTASESSPNTTGSQVSDGRTENNPRDILNRYAQLLTQAPTRDQYRPNIWSAVNAGLIGDSMERHGQDGIKYANEVLDKPFNEANEHYKQSLSGLHDLVGLSNSVNTSDLAQKNYSRLLDRDKVYDTNVQHDNALADQQFNFNKGEKAASDKARTDRENRLDQRDTERDRETRRHNRADEGLSQQRIDKPPKSGQPKFVSTKERRSAEQDAIDDIVNSDPTLEKFFEKDDKGNRILKAVDSEVEDKSSWWHPSTWKNPSAHKKLTLEERKLLQKHINNKAKQYLSETRGGEDD